VAVPVLVMHLLVLNGATAPTSSTEIAGKDGSGNLLPVTVTTAGLKVDGSANTQPVSGTVTANQGTAGAQKWLVDGSGVTQPISAAALPLPSGASTSALQTTGNTSLSSIDTKTPALGQALAAASVPVVLTAAQLTTLTPVSSVTATLAAGSAIVGKVGIDQTTPGTTNAMSVAQVGSTTVATGNGVVGAGVQRVAIASDNSTIAVNQTVSSTATLANVAGSASSVTIQASNASRLGLSVYNDSSANLYLKFGSAASTTSFTVLVPANYYYEMPSSRPYTGIVTGIWASATGSARVTELT
jgi:hypothetical protein